MIEVRIAMILKVNLVFYKFLLSILFFCFRYSKYEADVKKMYFLSLNKNKDIPQDIHLLKAIKSIELIAQTIFSSFK